MYWVIDWLSDQLIDLTFWDSPMYWLNDWLTDQLIDLTWCDSPMYWLADRSADWSNMVWFTDVLNNWLTDRSDDWSTDQKFLDRLSDGCSLTKSAERYLLGQNATCKFSWQSRFSSYKTALKTTAKRWKAGELCCFRVQYLEECWHDNDV